jgi:hypothetical protein
MGERLGGGGTITVGGTAFEFPANVGRSFAVSPSVVGGNITGSSHLARQGSPSRGLGSAHAGDSYTSRMRDPRWIMMLFEQAMLRVC